MAHLSSPRVPLSLLVLRFPDILSRGAARTEPEGQARPRPRPERNEQLRVVRASQRGSFRAGNTVRKRGEIRKSRCGHLQRRLSQAVFRRPSRDAAGSERAILADSYVKSGRSFEPSSAQPQSKERQNLSWAPQSSDSSTEGCFDDGGVQQDIGGGSDYPASI